MISFRKCVALVLCQLHLYISSGQRQPEYKFLASLKAKAHLPNLVHCIQGINEHF